MSFAGKSKQMGPVTRKHRMPDSNTWTGIVFCERGEDGKSP